MDEYSVFEDGIAHLLETARRQASQSVNAILTATYWGVGRRIVEFEQGGQQRAEYGEQLMRQLSTDLTGRFGRGFSGGVPKSVSYAAIGTWPASASSASRKAARRSYGMFSTGRRGVPISIRSLPDGSGTA